MFSFWCNCNMAHPLLFRMFSLLPKCQTASKMSKKLTYSASNMPKKITFRFQNVRRINIFLSLKYISEIATFFIRLFYFILKELTGITTTSTSVPQEVYQQYDNHNEYNCRNDHTSDQTSIGR